MTLRAITKYEVLARELTSTPTWSSSGPAASTGRSRSSPPTRKDLGNLDSKVAKQTYAKRIRVSTKTMSAAEGHGHHRGEGQH